MIVSTAPNSHPALPAPNSDRLDSCPAGTAVGSSVSSPAAPSAPPATSPDDPGAGVTVDVGSADPVGVGIAVPVGVGVAVGGCVGVKVTDSGAVSRPFGLTPAIWLSAVTGIVPAGAEAPTVKPTVSCTALDASNGIHPHATDVAVTPQGPLAQDGSVASANVVGLPDGTLSVT